MKKRIIVTGGAGQLGRELASVGFEDPEVIALDRRGCDIANREQVGKVLRQYRPQAVINAAAYTAVDKAESDRELAYRANVEGVRNLAEEACAIGARLVHVSTDYVFDGTASAPYSPEAAPNPLGVYGSTKLKGEKAFRTSGVEGMIIRTAWLYSSTGKNFLTTVLGMIRSGKDLRIVSDQIGTPTSAFELAPILVRCALDRQLNGVFHWTNAGSCTWYDFAIAIQQLARERSLIHDEVEITPILTKDYPTAARRPAYSVLDISFLRAAYAEPNHWREALANVLEGLADAARAQEAGATLN